MCNLQEIGICSTCNVFINKFYQLICVHITQLSNVMKAKKLFGVNLWYSSFALENKLGIGKTLCRTESVKFLSPYSSKPVLCRLFYYRRGNVKEPSRFLPFLPSFSWFFLIFPSFSQFLAIFWLSGGGTLPPLPSQWLFQDRIAWSGKNLLT